ncbi:ATP-binding protein [Streptomyces sp. NPDC006465]|uniref:ATP-binding protein n=1 Tax=Streptomyces sp. NPDC006465 TaxID=3157174 RepID=UPI0033A84399
MRDDHGIPVVTATVEIVQLIVSEPVTNARKYAPGPALLHLRVTSAVVRVELWDSNPAVPAAQALDPERVGQHGLEIVRALAPGLSASAGVEAGPPLMERRRLALLREAASTTTPERRREGAPQPSPS